MYISPLKTPTNALIESHPSLIGDSYVSPPSHLIDMRGTITSIYTCVYTSWWYVDWYAHMHPLRQTLRCSVHLNYAVCT